MSPSPPERSNISGDKEEIRVLIATTIQTTTNNIKALDDGDVKNNLLELMDDYFTGVAESDAPVSNLADCVYGLEDSMPDGSEASNVFSPIIQASAALSSLNDTARSLESQVHQKNLDIDALKVELDKKNKEIEDLKTEKEKSKSHDGPPVYGSQESNVLHTFMEALTAHLNRDGPSNVSSGA